MYECFHCGVRAVIWDSDFTFEDCGYEGEGLVHFCHCTNFFPKCKAVTEG